MQLPGDQISSALAVIFVISPAHLHVLYLQARIRKLCYKWPTLLFNLALISNEQDISN